jgi:NAD(P)H-flavin reductase
MFYNHQITEIGTKFLEFDYQTYLSREDKVWRNRGYVIDWIVPENISSYQEFYLCGSPAMVKSAREKLEALGVEKEKIFWEQF